MGFVTNWLLKKKSGPDGSVVRCSAGDLKNMSSILCYGSFLVREVALFLTSYLVRGDWLITCFTIRKKIKHIIGLCEQGPC